MIYIKVKTTYDHGEDITVQVGYTQAGEFVLDFCNHAGAVIEEIDYGYASYEKADWVDDFSNSLVCDKCEYTAFIEPEYYNN